MIGAILLFSLLTPWKVLHYQIPGSQGVLKSIKMIIKLKYDKEQHRGNNNQVSIFSYVLAFYI
jgi:hypothetical protein